MRGFSTGNRPSRTLVGARAVVLDYLRLRWVRLFTAPPR